MCGFVHGIRRIWGLHWCNGSFLHSGYSFSHFSEGLCCGFLVFVDLVYFGAGIKNERDGLCGGKKAYLGVM